MRNNIIIKKMLYKLLFLTAFFFLPACDKEKTQEEYGIFINDLADQYLEAWVKRYPELGTVYNLEEADHSRLTDYSTEAINNWDELEDQLYSKLETIKSIEKIASEDVVTYLYLKEALESSIQSRVCRSELWSINPVVGWHLTLFRLADIQPIGSEEKRQDAIARAYDIVRFIDTEIINLREGLKLGYLSAKEPVERIIVHIKNIISTDPEKSPLLGPAVRDTVPEFKTYLLKIISEDVYPAFTKYHDFLINEYLPAARTAAGVSANPDGQDCYRAMVRLFTTVDLEPEEIHRSGLDLVLSILEKRKELAAKYDMTPKEFLDHHNNLPENKFKSRRDMIAFSEKTIKRAMDESKKWFNILPRNDVKVEPVPEFQEQGAPGGYYMPGSPDGSRPGIYYMNTFNAQNQTKIGKETTAFHEAVPGHHFQLSIANEREDAHPVTKYIINSGFAEGWALYAEMFSDEIGLFSSDAQRMGMLNAQLGRAIRMVVDPGIHALGWTREQGLAFWGDTMESPYENFAGEVDRYIAWPGQAVSYSLGMLEIQRLREQVKMEYGDTFDLKRFHDCVLENGSAPINLLIYKMKNCF